MQKSQYVGHSCPTITLECKYVQKTAKNISDNYTQPTSDLNVTLNLFQGLVEI